MARKRLSAPFGAADPDAKIVPQGWRAETAPPISQVAGEASATAALEVLAGEMALLRASGRLVEVVPLAAVDENHLVRDRVAIDPEEMTALIESLRLYGQRQPVEVADLGQGRYGLISGWRRLTALRRLAAETGEARFATILILLRRPEAAAEAYVAMVEENEIRAALSYYERARIAAKAVEAGAFPSRQEALRALYASASRAKRSKIGSFLTLYDALDGVLRFPAAIPERLGLSLAARISVDPAMTARLRQDLESTDRPVAASEAGLLTAALAPAPQALIPPDPPVDIVPGIRLTTGRHRAVLSGPGVTPEVQNRLADWLRGS